MTTLIDVTASKTEGLLIARDTAATGGGRGRRLAYGKRLRWCGWGEMLANPSIAALEGGGVGLPLVGSFASHPSAADDFSSKMTSDLIGKAQRTYDARRSTMAHIATSHAVTRRTIFRNIRTDNPTPGPSR